MTLLWIPFTLLAALMQSLRSAYQKQLSTRVSTMGATLGRFIFALPLAFIYVIVLQLYYPNQSFPHFSAAFIRYAMTAAIFQIVATALLVLLLNQKNYAIGVGLAKSEAVIAAALGAVFFATPLSYLAWLGVLIGGIAVWLMSSKSGGKNATPVERLSLTTLGLGLACGLCFALCSLYLRESSQVLRNTQNINFLLSASWVLLFVLLVQTLLLTLWLLWREPRTLKVLFVHKRLTASVSVTSFIGSVGWFTAMSLETVAMVKTLGQVEVFFTLAISYCWFKESLSKNDYLGLGLIVLGAVLVVVA